MAAGFEIRFLLDLPITSLDNLFKSMLKARRSVLAEEARTMMYAAQGEPKELEQWLGRYEKSQPKAGNGDDFIRDFFGSRN